MEKDRKLGEAFISGRIINLDNTSLEDLKKFKSENLTQRQNVYKGMDSLIEEFRSI